MEHFISLAILPIKVVTIAILAVFSRIFHDQETLTASLIITRIVMSTFVLIVAFVSIKYLGASEDFALTASGALAFAFREVMDMFLSTVKDPLNWREVLTRKK